MQSGRKMTGDFTMTTGTRTPLTSEEGKAKSSEHGDIQDMRAQCWDPQPPRKPHTSLQPIRKNCGKVTPSPGGCGKNWCFHTDLPET